MIEPLLQAERTLNMGLLDEAERLFRQVAEHDPQNAIAMVGLARVAVERGDDHGAYALSLRALEIDPENAAAARMETRLAEVLAARGEPVERPRHALRAAARAEAASEQEARARSAGRPEPAVPRAVYGFDPGVEGPRARQRAGAADTEAGGSGPSPSGPGASRPPDGSPRRRGLLDRLLGRGR
ncbi:MAG TPA: tetratricopeptide repeat protein [Candidatus Limnocylindrales bacterium]|nr:tetratricopeptide repeat protein [Candidatus Limnocylindrales bacterium]